MTKSSIEELRELIAPLQGYPGRKIRHKASGDWYVISGIHFKEDDMRVWFSYHTFHKEPVSFLRPIEELTDGRFEVKGTVTGGQIIYHRKPGIVRGRP